MREELLDPLPESKTKATLIIGRDRVKCFLIDVTDDEIRVALPGAEQYEGDPRMMLVTRDGRYPVRLRLQEVHAGGYTYRLKHLTTEEAAKSKGFLKNFYFHHAGIKCVAAGLALSAVASFWFMSSGPQQFQLLCLRSIRRDISGWWPPSMNDKDKVPPGISINQSLVVEKNANAGNRDLERLEAVEESNNDLRTVSVSLISPASMTAPSLLPHDETSVVTAGSTKEVDSDSPNRSQKKKTVSLSHLLDEGRVGRLRTLTPELIPWLYGSAQHEQLSYLRISDSAFADLQQFELGLRGLPIETSTDTIENLRRAFSQSNNVNNARSVHGFDDIFVIKSNDADVYFRTHKGIVEIVRVLPIDFNKAG